MKQLIIMRGLPGSGKSTLAKSFGGVICSADDYFLDWLGRYRFDAAKLPTVHAKCRKKAAKAMEKGEKLVVIDNTNIQKWQFAPYLELAAKHGYNVRFEMPQTAWAWNVAECAKRNTHNVPLDAIQRMADQFEQ